MNVEPIKPLATVLKPYGLICWQYLIFHAQPAPLMDPRTTHCLRPPSGTQGQREEYIFMHMTTLKGTYSSKRGGWLERRTTFGEFESPFLKKPSWGLSVSELSGTKTRSEVSNFESCLSGFLTDRQVVFNT